MSRTYSVAEAKAKLSQILRTVKQGRSVTISERGKEVARVVPLRSKGNLRRRLDDLEESGVLTKARESIESLHPLVRRPGALARFLASRD